MSDFTPLNQVGNYIVNNLQQVGWIICGIVIVGLAIILITSGGSEQRVEFVKRAGIYVVTGAIILMGVFWIVTTIRNVTAPLQQTQPATPVTAPASAPQQ